METRETIFEEIKKVNEYGSDYWDARELMPVLGYETWERFLGAINRAKKSCESLGIPVSEHFSSAPRKNKQGRGRPQRNYNLSRYGCYLVAQNGDPEKLEIAQAQAYFAIQTRRQEISDAYLEDSKRVKLRGEMAHHNKKLSVAADKAGVKRYALFHDAGYKGLYGGLTSKDIAHKKELHQNEKILDHMGSEELAANLFRATQTEAKLKRESIQGEYKAIKTHTNVGTAVRKTIESLGGTMPEELPNADNITSVQKRIKQNNDKKELLSKDAADRD